MTKQTDPADAIGAILDSSLKEMRQANADQLATLDQLEAEVKKPKATKAELREAALACIVVTRRNVANAEGLAQAIEQTRETAAQADRLNAELLQTLRTLGAETAGAQGERPN